MGLNEDWLATTVEEILEPELPICDPHHHLWDTGMADSANFRKEQVEPRYLLDELRADLGSGHNVVSTVFIECASMYREDGPAELRPVGETEFVNGVAAMSASGLYGPTRIAAAIIGFADLMLGDGAASVLEAHIAAGGGRFRGIRHAASWDPSPDVRNSHTNPFQGMLADATFRGFCPSGAVEYEFRRLVLSSANSGNDSAGPRIPGHHDHPKPLWRAPGRWSIRGQARRMSAAMAPRHRRLGGLPERGREIGRDQHAGQWL